MKSLSRVVLAMFLLLGPANAFAIQMKSGSYSLEKPGITECSARAKGIREKRRTASSSSNIASGVSTANTVSR